MKIILAKDVAKLGSAGDIVKVKDGYARNYLIPKGLGLIANEKNEKQLEFNKRVIEKKINTETIEAKLLASKLAACEIKIKKKVGEEGKLFGSVTNREIEAALKESGFEINHKDIVLDSNIKKSGVYEVEVKLFRDVKGVFKLWVVSEESDEVVSEQTPVEPDTAEKSEQE
ncbi:MAG TPA: 50S ribosomal protein L9 [bacterium]|nr:50S ribosomal protein L9 [bacterium]